MECVWNVIYVLSSVYSILVDIKYYYKMRYMIINKYPKK